MRSMTRMALAGCMALATLSVVTVLSVGAPTAHAATCVSPFAGSWSGTYLSRTDPPYSGSIDWTISNAGLITGTYINYVNGPGTVDGHVNDDGHLVLVFRPSLGGCWTFLGTTEIDGGILFATYTNPWPEQIGGFTEDAILEMN
jgi:hypothetical protein